MVQTIQTQGRILANEWGNCDLTACWNGVRRLPCAYGKEGRMSEHQGAITEREHMQKLAIFKEHAHQWVFHE